jgi:hypothetical protein
MPLEESVSDNTPKPKFREFGEVFAAATGGTSLFWVDA